VVVGLSVGGITAIRGAARFSDIDALVAIGGYTSLDPQINQKYAPALSSRWIVQRLVPIFFRLETGVHTSQLRPVDDVAAISPRPLLLIYGDEEIDQAGGREQFAAASQPKELWVVPGTGHEGYLNNQPAEFR
jgi:pimeloyl-ACP methyl ester carboxylesterase